MRRRGCGYMRPVFSGGQSGQTGGYSASLRRRSEGLGSLDLERLKQEAGEHGITYGLLPALEPLENGSRSMLAEIPQMPPRPLPGQDKVDYRELGNIVNVKQGPVSPEKHLRRRYCG
jgi:hypothetical protein